MQTEGNSFLPNLFLLGAAKCGTTTLHDYLSNMPELCMSNPKEPFFFECEFEKGMDFYQTKYFHHYNGEKLIGESRHRNLYLPYVPERIFGINPASKLLIILRNPTERAFSHWWHAFSRGYEKLSFHQAIEADLERIASGKHLDTSAEIQAYCSKEDYATFYRTYVDTGYYQNQIDRYLKLFNHDQLKVVLTEDLERNPAKVINDVRIFLGLEPIISEEIKPLHSNKQKPKEAGKAEHQIVRWLQLHRILSPSLKKSIYLKYNEFINREQKIPKKTKKMLQRHYQPHNEALGNFLNINLSHWNS